MIHHLVLLKIRRDVPKKEVEKVFVELANLRKLIPGLLSFSGGPYSSPEGMNKGYTHGFAMTFADAKARDRYLPHPAHEQAKKLVLAVLEGGLEGVVAVDFES